VSAATVFLIIEVADADAGDDDYESNASVSPGSCTLLLWLGRAEFYLPSCATCGVLSLDIMEITSRSCIWHRILERK